MEWTWVTTASLESTGKRLPTFERRIAGHPYETATGFVEQDRFTQEVTAEVWIDPSMQAGMQETQPRHTKKKVQTIEQGQVWVIAQLQGLFNASPTPWSQR